MEPVISQTEKVSLESLYQQEKNLICSIDAFNFAIRDLQDMPLSREDYCSFIPEYIERFGREEYAAFKGQICGDGVYGRAERWGDLEKENGEIIGLFTLPGLAGLNNFSDGWQQVMRKLCFFFPELVANRLIDVIMQDDSVEWGNDEYPPLEERRERVAALVNKRAEYESELKALREKIAQMTESSNPSCG